MSETSTEIVWRPDPERIEQANVTRFMRRWKIEDADELRARAAADQEWFWPAAIDDLGIEFERPYETLRETSRGIPWTDWFVGGRLNLVANCLDRHAGGPRAEELCLLGLSETGEEVRYTFRTLHHEVTRCAAALRRAGVEPGNRVAAFMPMVAEVVVQMLGCLKAGAVFIPIFSGYAPQALAERLRGAGVKLLFTAERSVRRGSAVEILPAAREAVAESPSVERVVIVQRPPLRGERPDLALDRDREVVWSEFLAAGSGGFETVIVDAMAPALILFTSGTTGRPKGTVHSHAGTLVQLAKEVGYAFDMKPGERFFWLTDIGWMMGPWAIIGGLFHGAAVVVYEGAFDHPTRDQLWKVLEEHRVTVFGISPTAIRMLMRFGDGDVSAHDLSALRILGSTGEPWDEESWQWYFEKVGGRRCPVINISGGTDIIGCFLSPLPIDPLKPCTLVGPGLGMAVDVWDEEGEPVRGEVGYLVATQPAPSMTRGLWGDPERYLETYWSRWPNVWNHGDWARIDEDGFWFLQGRSDDTLKVAGRRIGPAELEGALIETGKVSEAAAIGVPHPIKGTGIVCFAVLKPGVEASEELRGELEAAVVDRLGKVDRPERIEFVDDLPKTRSAKILRRMVRARYLGEELGDLSSLQNPEAVEGIPVAEGAR
ncbi:MAG TPA: AMP-binding protein [Thermoanaerobaculia bacterium]|nr:AMP-binding protein [Thermoanaerobaculia bacterium]